MQIELYYKNTKIGSLFCKEQNFEFVPVQKNKNIDNLSPIIALKNLDITKSTKSLQLFSIFEDIYQSVINRKDILCQLGQIDTQNKFEVLFKFAKLQQYKQNFHLKAIK
ncbi:MAG: hypothetical protein PHQ62_03715 [Clostridia bacterium]|nr:hypothetical protein [Clostridia bacterium]